MDIPNPVTTALVTAATLQAAKQGQDFIAAAAGHPGESLGTIFGNWGRRRFENAETIGTKAHFILLNIGEQVGRVPLNVLQPILEGASLQEDPDVQQIWENLLANAADGRNPGKVQPSFVYILKELTPTAAVLLDALYTHVMTDRKGMIEDVEFDMMDLKRIQNRIEFGPDVSGIVAVETQFMIMIDVLVRNRLLNARVESETKQIHESRVAAVRFSLSQLGASFLLACRRPIATKEILRGE